MHGPGPGIHASRRAPNSREHDAPAPPPQRACAAQGVDGRDEPGHDGEWYLDQVSLRLANARRVMPGLGPGIHAFRRAPDKRERDAPASAAVARLIAGRRGWPGQARP
jgi:hypothetical protein